MRLIKQTIGDKEILRGDGAQYQMDENLARYNTALNDPTNEIVNYTDTPQYVQDQINQAERAERDWRNQRLLLSDIEIAKAEDIAGAFNASDWRAYRILLRNWPDNADFPDSTKRPVSP